MRPICLLACLTLLALSTLTGCPDKAEGPSIKAQGHGPGQGDASGGPSGEAAMGTTTVDADGRRLETLEYLSDGVTIRGDLVLPARADPAPTVVLVHMLGSSRQAWHDTQLLLADEGIGSFAIDLRGHGGSEGGPDGYKDFSDLQWQAAAADVRNAIFALEDFPERINVDRLALMGASIGANYAVTVAADLENIPVIGLSAGANYKGVRVQEAITTLGRRVFLAGQTGDESANQLLEWAIESEPTVQVELDEGNAHGTNMLPNVALESQMFTFLRDRWGVMATEPGGTMPEGLDLGGLLDDDEPAMEFPEEDDWIETPPADDTGGDDDPDIRPPTEDDFNGVD